MDLLAATEEGTNRLNDPDLLRVAASLGRVMFTHDVRFRSLAEQWQRDKIDFAGLVFGPAIGVSIGQYVRDLELIAKASQPEDWRNMVIYLPL